MRKRIRIRKVIVITAFAAVAVGIVGSPAQARQVGAEFPRDLSASCDTDPRLVQIDPQMCRQAVFANFTEDKEQHESPSSSSSSSWTAQSTVSVIAISLALIVGLAAVTRYRPGLPG